MGSGGRPWGVNKVFLKMLAEGKRREKKEGEGVRCGPERRRGRRKQREKERRKKKEKKRLGRACGKKKRKKERRKEEEGVLVGQA